MLSQAQRTAILELSAKAVSKREIARVLQVSRLTVRKVLRSNSTQVPEIQRQFTRFDWYHPNPRLSFEDIDQIMSDIESQNVKMMALYREGIRNK